PIGIIGSLLICTVLYILVSGIATGVVPYTQLDVPDPIAVAADRAGLAWKWHGLSLIAVIIKLGAIAGLSSVILVMLLGQSRVFYSMARDGLLPPVVSRVHPRFRTPWVTSIITGLIVAFFSAVFTVREAGSLCSIGTLLAFVIVSAGILVLRIREPNLPRRFKTPWVWFVAPMGAISALVLMAALPWPTWERLIIWFAIGMEVYFGYAIYHSKLGQGKPPGETAWSRALKLAGVTWMVFGTLASLLWMFRYQERVMPGQAIGWLYGVVGLAVCLTIGVILEVVAMVSDHLHAGKGTEALKR
ncbi:MAG TPA: amino acid permease, partial [Candidatus Sulfotelmatobacter sp.]|nr:amino acid permease [Candidatus Sulfotelmatobacter sp.]